MKQNSSVKKRLSQFLHLLHVDIHEEIHESAISNKKNSRQVKERL